MFNLSFKFVYNTANVGKQVKMGVALMLDKSQ